MSKKALPIVTVTLDKIVGGGQALTTMENGQKLFVWGGLPGETVEVQLTKKKSKMAEGIVVNVLNTSADRIEPVDPESFISTSPWQIMTTDAEQHYKAALIEEAFELHDIVLPHPISVYTNDNPYHYRNKVEFSWWWDTDTNMVDLAFFRRGTHGKLPVSQMSLARPEILAAALNIRNLLRKKEIEGRNLKTLLVRSTQDQKVAAQLYLKDELSELFSVDDFSSLAIQGLEIIYSNPKSPASVITKRLQTFGDMTLTDTVRSVSFDYAVEGFFQINLPVYEKALGDMAEWIDPAKPTVDLYSGVGSIGLTIGSDPLTLVEVNEAAVAEMKRNIRTLGRDGAVAVLATAETALDHISNTANIIVDPPRAGLHQDVVDTLLQSQPERIIYLSCNPATQARDVALLSASYGVAYHQGYNFFPRTPHIEHLVVLERKTTSA